MKIALVRHFKVDISWKSKMNTKDFKKWVIDYNNNDVIIDTVDLNDINYDKCYVSPLKRAVKTAQSIYNGEIIKLEELREVELSPIIDTKLKLHYNFWAMSSRLAWILSHKSQKESKKETVDRGIKALDIIEKDSSENILIVCHGFIMAVLSRELIKRGYKGNKINKVKNGEVFVFIKE